MKDSPNHKASDIHGLKHGFLKWPTIDLCESMTKLFHLVAEEGFVDHQHRSNDLVKCQISLKCPSHSKPHYFLALACYSLTQAITFHGHSLTVQF
jgi:hypothetical protein